MMKASRAVVAIMAALVVAGCGDDQRSGTARTASGAAADAFPVTIAGKLGTATIPSAPKRVVALDTASADAALAVGVVPVAIANAPATGSKLPPWTQGALRRIGAPTPTVMDGQQLSVEKIAAQRPDVILALGSFGVAQVYDKLRSLAPVVSYERGAVADTWQSLTLRVGTALGRRPQAQAAVVAAEQEISTTAAHAGLRGKTISFFNFIAQPFLVKEPDDASVRFLAGLGMKPPTAVRGLPQEEGGRTKVSLERLDLLEADVVMATAPNPAELQAFERRPIFRRLKAVREGHYLRIPIESSLSMAFPSVASVPWALQNLVPKIQAVD